MKKILIGLGVVVGLVVALAVIVPFLIPADAYIGRVAAAVKQATGRDLKIDGPVSVRLLPNIALEATKVSLSNAPGAADKTMVSIGKLDVGLKLIPLLSKRVEVSRLDLDQPVIHLEIDRAGEGNWVFHPAPSATPAPATREAAPENKPASDKAAATGGDMEAQLRQLSLGTIKITDGTVSYLDARTGKRQDLAKLDASLTLTSIDDPLTLKGSAEWQGQSVSVNLNAGKPSALISGGSTTLSLKVDAPLLKLDIDGSASSVGPLKKMDGTIDVSSSSVRNLAKWAGSPVALAGNGLGPLSLKSKFEAGGTAVSLSQLVFSLDAIKATGDVAVNAGGARPSVKGNLSLGALDLNPYIASGAEAQPGTAPIAAPAAPGGGWSTAPINLAPLKTVDASLNLSLDSLRLHDILIGKSVMAITLANGRLRTDFKQVTLYGGTATGHIGVDGSGAAMGLETDMTLSNIQVQPLLQATVGSDKITGAGSVTLALNGHGHNQSELMQGLSGMGSLHIANGALKGFDLAAIVKNPETALTENRQTAQTAFSALGGTFTVAGGVASNMDLAMETGVGGVTGAGTIDLFHQTMDYKIEPHVASTLQGGKSGIAGTVVPIIIQGPWSNLTYRPDLNSVLQQKAQKAIGGKLNKLLGDKTGGNGSNSQAGKLLGGLFGH